jgi:ubiquinone/menaquinone biosynthesis C-methylase UbiE
MYRLPHSAAPHTSPNIWFCAVRVAVAADRLNVRQVLHREDAMDQHGAWQVGGTAAELYQRYLVPSIASLWAVDLINRAAPRLGERVLDVACGTGVVARVAAERMGSGRIVGLDINPRMLAVARSLPADETRVIEWQEGSALALPFSDDAFDLVVCQFGLQFFPDKPAALGEMRRVLAPSGRVALSVFTAIEHTPASNALADALDRHLGVGASQTKRSEHVLSDRRELHELVTAAGFRNVAIETVTQTICFTSAREYVRVQLSATPMSSLIAGMDDTRQQETLAAITSDLVTSLHIGSDTAELIYPQEAYVLLASK